MIVKNSLTLVAAIALMIVNSHYCGTGRFKDDIN